MCGAIMICVLLAATAEKGSGVTSPAGLGGAGLEGGDEGPESTQPSETSAAAAESGEQEEQRCSCPLCSEKFPSQDRLESHAMSVHSVNSEGLQRLQSLINGSHWLNKKEGKLERKTTFFFQYLGSSKNTSLF